MTGKLLTEHHFEVLNLKGGCTGSYESKCHIVGNHMSHNMSRLMLYHNVMEISLLILEIMVLWHVHKVKCA